MESFEQFYTRLRNTLRPGYDELIIKLRRGDKLIYFCLDSYRWVEKTTECKTNNYKLISNIIIKTSEKSTELDPFKKYVKDIYNLRIVSSAGDKEGNAYITVYTNPLLGKSIIEKDYRNNYGKLTKDIEYGDLGLEGIWSMDLWFRKIITDSNPNILALQSRQMVQARQVRQRVQAREREQYGECNNKIKYIITNFDMDIRNEELASVEEVPSLNANGNIYYKVFYYNNEFLGLVPHNDHVQIFPEYNNLSSPVFTEIINNIVKLVNEICSEPVSLWRTIASDNIDNPVDQLVYYSLTIPEKCIEQNSGVMDILNQLKINLDVTIYDPYDGFINIVINNLLECHSNNETVTREQFISNFKGKFIIFNNSVVDKLSQECGIEVRDILQEEEQFNEVDIGARVTLNSDTGALYRTLHPPYNIAGQYGRIGTIINKNSDGTYEVDMGDNIIINLSKELMILQRGQSTELAQTLRRLMGQRQQRQQRNQSDELAQALRLSMGQRPQRNQSDELAEALRLSMEQIGSGNTFDF